jgi:3D (Asp-Asp-Asp) domain-containing protein
MTRLKARAVACGALVAMLIGLPLATSPSGHLRRELAPESKPEAKKGVSIGLPLAGPRALYRIVTAYNSDPAQTDATPCIAADGSDICRRHREGEEICAANFVPFGTRLRIGGGLVCTVADRMGRQSSQGVDIFMGDDLAAARVFGRRRLVVEIIACAKVHSPC